MASASDAEHVVLSVQLSCGCSGVAKKYMTNKGALEGGFWAQQRAGRMEGRKLQPCISTCRDIPEKLCQAPGRGRRAVARAAKAGMQKLRDNFGGCPGVAAFSCKLLFGSSPACWAVLACLEALLRRSPGSMHHDPGLLPSSRFPGIRDGRRPSS